jgi:catechol 2,3-dioxygenase-like lactoylglutathione lyase family enzyme
MKRTWTIIGVSDVPASFKWYLSLFGQPEAEPAHSYFGQIVDSDGTVLLCLHKWGDHEHPSLTSRDKAIPGNGLLLFFRVYDFDRALARARALVGRFEEEPHTNPNTRTEEFSVRDLDGYYVTISAFSSLELTTIDQPVPELPVADVEKAQQYYRDFLGFEIGWLYPGNEIGAVSRGEVAIFFRRRQKPFEPAVHWIFASAIDATYEELQASGAKIVEPLEKKPWGLRQFTVEDLDGNRFYFHCD